jgi:FkbM family methyltransferase
MKLRTLVERLARNRSFARRFPSEFGRRPIQVSPDAALRWLKPDASAFETALLAIARHFIKPGMVTWDIGANVGVFTVAAGHLSGAPVLAIEADPFLAGLLRRTSARNPDLHIDILCVAVGDRDGVARFRVAGRGRASSGIEGGELSTQHGETRQILNVPMLTLDRLLDDFPAPQFVKVDVEGAELLLLAGAETLLRDVRPTLLIEVTDKTRAQAARVFETAGYRLLDGDTPPGEQRPASSATTNVLALPDER